MKILKKNFGILIGTISHTKIKGMTIYVLLLSIILCIFNFFLIIITERRIMDHMSAIQPYGCLNMNTSVIQNAIIKDISQHLSQVIISRKVKVNAEPDSKQSHPNSSSSWDLIQNQRRSLLESKCKELLNKTRIIPNMEELLMQPRRFLKNIMVDDVNKILYCYIPKVACTQWKKIMMVLTKNVPMWLIDQVPIGKIHRTHQKFLNSPRYQTEDIVERLKYYNKFLIVRHPTERLLSAFNDKFNSNSYDSAAFKRSYASQMMSFARKTSDIPSNGEGMKFSEFLHFIATRNPMYLQEHWKPYLHLCFPCTIKYDYIGKYETLQIDSNYILESISASSELRFPEFRPTNTAQTLKQILPTIPSDILDKVYRTFMSDFDLFGYDRNVQ